MGFRNGAYAKVWSIEQVSPMNTKLRISVSRKDKKTDKYVQDFSGFVNCIGADCAKKAMNLSEGARIKLGDVDVSTTYNEEKKTTYTSFKIFSFEQDGETEKPQNDVFDGDVDDKSLPF